MVGHLLIVLAGAWSLILSLLPVQGPVAHLPQNGWLTDWDNRIKITFDQSKIDGTLTDFPILVHLSRSSGINSSDLSNVFNELGTDDNRRKIALTTGDGITQCFAEIEKWDSVIKEAWLWVKVPRIACDENPGLYLYFDKNAAENSSFVGDVGSLTAQKVWGNNFVMVQHFGQKGNGTVGEYKDSTHRHNNGTAASGVPNRAPTRVNSLIGDGQFFNGMGDYIEVPDSDDFSINTTGSLTISAWISPSVLNFTDSGGYIRWMGKGKPGQAEWQIRMYDTNTTEEGRGGTRSQWISFYVHGPQGGLGAGGGGPHDFLNPGDWIFLTARSDMVKSYMTFDGTSDGIHDSWANFKIQYANGSDPLRIGTLYPELDEWWNGKIDEVRISNEFLSNSWIKADYYSQSDGLLFFNFDYPPASESIGAGIFPESNHIASNANSDEKGRVYPTYFIIVILGAIGIIIGGIQLLRYSSLRRLLIYAKDKINSANPH